MTDLDPQSDSPQVQETEDLAGPPKLENNTQLIMSEISFLSMEEKVAFVKMIRQLGATNDQSEVDAIVDNDVFRKITADTSSVAEDATPDQMKKAFYKRFEQQGYVIELRNAIQRIRERVAAPVEIEKLKGEPAQAFIATMEATTSVHELWDVHNRLVPSEPFTEAIYKLRERFSPESHDEADKKIVLLIDAAEGSVDEAYFRKLDELIQAEVDIAVPIVENHIDSLGKAEEMSDLKRLQNGFDQTGLFFDLEERSKGNANAQASSRVQRLSEKVDQEYKAAVKRIESKEKN